MRVIFFVILSLFITASVVAQDSLFNLDTVRADTLKAADSLAFLTPRVTADSARSFVVRKSFFQCYNTGWFFLQKRRLETGKEEVFYAIIFLLLTFGVLRVSFPRYSTDMFRFYFQSTLRIHQVKEQLSHSFFAGAFYNLLFFFGVGLYLFLLSSYYMLSFRVSTYHLLYISPIILILIYGVKNIMLSIIGWAFGLLKAARLYLFITFLTNKIMGVLLLPFLVGIAFGDGHIQNFMATLSITLVISLFVYRFFRAYQPLHEDFQIGFFQYIAFLMAAEFAPLLLIYKLLIQYL